MRKLLYTLLMLLFSFSCSKNDDIIDKIEKEEHKKEEPAAEKKAVKPKLSVSHKEKNIFEMVKFTISIDANDLPFMHTFTLSDTYDSIVWKVVNLEKSRKVFSYSSNSASFTFQWGHNFFLPDEYKTCLLGYKDNAVIYSDTISIQITNNKDFLGYNWADITKQGEHVEGFQDALSQKAEFSIFKTFQSNTPGVRLFLIGTPASDKILSKYITRLYSTPSYTTDNADLLLKKYQVLFKYKKEKASPQCIWITPTAKIVLLSCNDEYNIAEYEIYAEPNK